MKLYQEIIFLDNFFKGQYCVENVISYYDPLIKPIEHDRHYFWTNFKIGFKRQQNGQNILRGSTENAIINKGLQDFTIENVNKRLVVNNAIHPETGLYILNCARGIITKQNEKQIDLFI
ncbi:unnamed protein product [marine sediment metagenome]|uniref:Uncharacterized protein n=1 Tax=marine sediment metagenome TaxID=412755 RepID=X1A213_9ZZZZ